MQNLLRVPKGGAVKGNLLIVLMALTLVACSQGGPSFDRGDCSDGVCVALRVVEPVQFNAPVVVMITVTSDQDRSGLGLTLYTDAIQATIDGPQGWESNARKGNVFKNGPSDGAGWSFDAKANVPVPFTRVLHFSDKDQLTEVYVALNVPPRTFVAFAHANIKYSRDGVQVYGMGTPIPGLRTPAPETLPAWIVRPDGTRIPYPTLLPTPTFAPRTRPPTPTRPPYP
jgi:hypothetical protein